MFCFTGLTNLYRKVSGATKGFLQPPGDNFDILEHMPPAKSTIEYKKDLKALIKVSVPSNLDTSWEVAQIDVDPNTALERGKKASDIICLSPSIFASYLNCYSEGMAIAYLIKLTAAFSEDTTYGCGLHLHLYGKGILTGELAV